jgi:hypothetical protein
VNVYDDDEQTEKTTLMSDALTDINENGAEEDAHGRHRGHLSESEVKENSSQGNPATHGRHRRAE